MANDKKFFKKISLDAIVVSTINGRNISIKEYRERNEKAVKSYKEGKFKTSQALKEKFKAR